MQRWKIGGLSSETQILLNMLKAMAQQGISLKRQISLSQRIKKAFEAGGVHVIELPVDYSENQKVLIDELAKKVCLI